jgi:hypothetical protein
MLAGHGPSSYRSAELKGRRMPASDLDKQLHQVILRALAGRTTREAAALLNLASTTISGNRLKETFRTDSLWRLLSCRVPVARELAGRILVQERFGSPDKVAAVLDGGTVIPEEKVNLWRMKRDLARRARREASSSREFYMHAALQLETADFPRGRLAAMLFDGVASSAEIQAAAVEDLICAFMNAGFFAWFARSMRRRQRDLSYEDFPKHPSGGIQLSDRFKGERPPHIDENILEQLRRIGRSTRDIFQQEGNYSSSIPTPQKSSQTAYEYLHYSCDFKMTKFKVWEPELIAASAATVAFRTTIATLQAANTMLSFGVWQLPDQLYSICSKISELCHFIYLERQDDMLDALRILNQEEENSDLLGFRQDYSLSIRSTGEGSWFPAFDYQWAFVSGHSSLLRSRDDTKVIHRFVSPGHEDDLPREYVPGSPVYYWCNR